MQQHSLAADFSPLTAMLQSLGQPLNQLLNSQLSGARALKGVDGRLTTSLGAESRVLLSQCGTWGDPGTADSGWVFFLQEASIKRLLESTSEPENYWLPECRGWVIAEQRSGPMAVSRNSQGLIIARCSPLFTSGARRRFVICGHAQAASPRVSGL